MKKKTRDFFVESKEPALFLGLDDVVEIDMVDEGRRRAAWTRRRFLSNISYGAWSYDAKLDEQN